MTNVIGPVGEEDLQAWVDGRLSPERTDAVDAYLAAHPEERVRLSQYAEQRQALRTAFGPPAAPIPTRLQVARLIESRRHRQHLHFAQIAAAILLLTFGGIAGWNARDIGNPFGWGTTTEARVITADAVEAYRTFEVEVRHPVEVPAAQGAHLGQWLSNRLGRPLIIPDLTPLGLQLMGGRLLPSGTGPAAQLMYEDANSNRLAVYIRAGLSGDTRLYRPDKSVNALFWSDEGFGCAIVGHANRDFLTRVGAAVYEQILPNAPKGEISGRVKEG